MEYKILTSQNPHSLTNQVNEYIKEGWKPVGGHSVVESHRQNRFRGSELVDTLIQSEYSQTIVKE